MSAPSAPSARDLAATVRAGLDDGCAFACGCDRPGDAAACIHADRFEALAALEKLVADEQARELRLAQGLRVIRDTTGEYAANVASRALIEAGVPDPPDEDHL
ncbi:MAG TPA: hypothetical protein VLE97_10450 [Gaiellaceae bacterium]|nr:hypothetical protein [Gaiellaceae bacterium]